MRGKLLAVTALAVGSALSLVGGATAAGAAGGGAATTVTIRAQGTDLSGTVKSPAPSRCASERNVIVFKQIGSKGGGNDINFASDIAQANGNGYEWNTGNTGTPGKFYAKVRPKQGCQGDTSPTVRARRS